MNESSARIATRPMVMPPRPQVSERQPAGRADVGPPKIKVENLDFFYGQARALKAISVNIANRKVTAMIGPSGCGKSTLLRVFNRMYDLYPGQRATGTVLLDDTNLIDPRLDVTVVRSRIGMVFQKPTPFPMTIYDNISFGVRLHERLTRQQMDERV